MATPLWYVGSLTGNLPKFRWESNRKLAQVPPNFAMSWSVSIHSFGSVDYVEDWSDTLHSFGFMLFNANATDDN